MISILTTLVAIALLVPLEGRLIVKTLHANHMHMMYRDHGSGAYEDLSIYCPHPPTGFSILGHYAEKGYIKKTTAHVLVVKEVNSSTLLAHPVRFRQIWNTKFTGGRSEAAIWRPIPPPGYVCMGDVITLSASEAPPADTIVCLHSSLVSGSKGKRVWWNKISAFCGSRFPQKNVALWQPGSKRNCQSPNTFVAQKGFLLPSANLELFHCLREVERETDLEDEYVEEPLIEEYEK